MHVPTQSSYADILTAHISERDCIWRQAPERGTGVKMRSIAYVLIPCDGCPYTKRRFGQRYTHGEDGVKTGKRQGKGP